MVTKYVNQPLGMGLINAPQPKLWIATAIGAAAGIGASIYGGIRAAGAANEAERRQRAQEAQEDAWYKHRYYEDYVDTAAGQNLVRRAKDYAREQWRKAAGAQAVAGGTEASVARAKEAGNKMVGDTIANIASTDQQRKAQVDNMHRQAEAQHAQMDIARQQQRAQNISNAAQSASNAIMAVGSAVDQASAQKPDLGGGNNNGTEVVKSDGGNGATVHMNNMAGNTVHLKSNVGGISGDYDADKLRDLIGAPR